MIRRGGCSDVAAAPRALYPNGTPRTFTDSILSTSVIDRDREEVGYHISAGNGDGEKVNKLATKKSNSLTSMPPAYSGVAGRAGSWAGFDSRMRACSPALPGSYSFREDPKLLALFAQHESRRT